MTHSVVIADDHPLFRDGLRGLLERDGRFTVVGEAQDGDGARDALLRLRPRIALLDHSMPRRRGSEVIGCLRQELVSTRFALLSSFGSPILIAEALRSGADGYLLKEDPPAAIADALFRIAEGACVISAAVDPVALRDARASLGITAREHEVLSGVLRGDGAPELAARLGLSPRTVETYRNQLAAKFGARNLADLVRRAVEAGFSHGPP